MQATRNPQPAPRETIPPFRAEASSSQGLRNSSCEATIRRDSSSTCMRSCVIDLCNSAMASVALAPAMHSSGAGFLPSKDASALLPLARPLLALCVGSN